MAAPAQDYASIERVFSTRAKEFSEVSSFIHANPELAFQEHKSHDFLCQKLKAEGFSVSEHYLGCDTAFLAAYEKTPGGTTVCVICEYDALPNVGHACGHNLIAEAGFAAGVAIKTFLADNPQVKGKVVVMGTPAEESGAGKQLLIDRGAFNGIDCAMMVHPANTGNETHPFFIGVQVLLAEFRGRAAHAAGFPWEGKNALDGAVTCYNGLAMLRQHIKPKCRVHAVITNGGTAANVVPEYASLSIMYRAPTLDELDELGCRVEHCVKAGALLSNTDAEISQAYPRYLPLKSNSVLGRCYQQHCESAGMSFEDPKKQGSFVASSDIGNVSMTVPTIHPIFHIDSQGPNHSKEFTRAAATDEAQRNTLTAAKAMAKTGVDIFCQPALLTAMKNEFQKDPSSSRQTRTTLEAEK